LNVAVPTYISANVAIVKGSLLRMKNMDLLQVAIFFVLLIMLTPLLGVYIARIFEEKKIFCSWIVQPVENFIYRISGINPELEMNWTQYTWCVVVFNIIGFSVLLVLQLFQSTLPLNPEKLPNVPFALALNTAISYFTNTNWQAYSGEAVMSYFVQVTGLTVQNFLSAATGIAVMIALTKALTRKKVSVLGNFWVDVTRSTLYIRATS